MEDQDINLYWRRIVDTMSDGLILVGTNGSIILVNQSVEQLAGYSSDEIIGRPCTILMFLKWFRKPPKVTHR
ncbi:MAG: PAS domain S-box protein [Desulfobacterales bacterium]|nr:MAG: PAS domain S-box protein [Desulfobacterales bacterium]